MSNASDYKPKYAIPEVGATLEIIIFQPQIMGATFPYETVKSKSSARETAITERAGFRDTSKVLKVPRPRCRREAARGPFKSNCLQRQSPSKHHNMF